MTRNKKDHPIFQNVKGFISSRIKEKGESWVQDLIKAQEDVLEIGVDLYDVVIELPHSYKRIYELAIEKKLYSTPINQDDPLFKKRILLDSFNDNPKYLEQGYDGYFQAGVNSIVSKCHLFIRDAVQKKLKIKDLNDELAQTVKVGRIETKIRFSDKKEVKIIPSRDEEITADEEPSSPEIKESRKRPLPNPQQPIKSILKKSKIEENNK